MFIPGTKKSRYLCKCAKHVCRLPGNSSIQKKKYHSPKYNRMHLEVGTDFSKSKVKADICFPISILTISVTGNVKGLKWTVF